jgi:hypothetical protein
MTRQPASASPKYEGLGGSGTAKTARPKRRRRRPQPPPASDGRRRRVGR